MSYKIVALKTGDDVPEGAKYLTTTVRHNEFSDAVTHYFLIKKGKK
jgi:hypothetical protein